MTDTLTPVETQAPDDGPVPIYDTDFLRQRIAALDADRQERLGGLWVANGIGALEGLWTAEQYAKAERLVNNCEPTVMNHVERGALREQLDALPEHIRSAAIEALDVYAPTLRKPDGTLLVSTGRFAEAQRIISEAVEYAATLESTGLLVDPSKVIPTVADLPPVDDSALVTESSEYPGSKADAKTVLAWVGSDRNRAARAYAHEQERATARKGLSAKLVDILGPDGLAKVQEALAASAPPPLNLGGGPLPPEPTAVAPAAAAVEGAVGVEDSGATASPVESSPAAPEVSGPALADAFAQIGAGFLALAEAVRDVA